MLDDIDRDCCYAIEKSLSKNLPKEWSVVDRVFHDPGVTLTLEHNTEGFVSRPIVTVQISYGRPVDNNPNVNV